MEIESKRSNNACVPVLPFLPFFWPFLLFGRDFLPVDLPLFGRDFLPVDLPLLGRDFVPVDFPLFGRDFAIISFQTDSTHGQGRGTHTVEEVE